MVQHTVIILGEQALFPLKMSLTPFFMEEYIGGIEWLFYGAINRQINKEFGNIKSLAS
jgi:hypothetical protein